MSEPESNSAQTEMQAGLTAAAKGGARGLFAKYREIFLGRAPLILYELAMTVAANTGGALGFLLRKQLYSRLLGRCGRGAVFGKGVVLRHPERIWIGDGAVIDDGVVLDAKGPDGEAPNIHLGDNVFLGRNTILSCKGGTIALGDNTNFGANCQIQSESSCQVGANVLFASYCYVIAGGNHGVDRVDVPPIQQPSTSRGGVKICDGAWLGANVKVIDGVEMGRDSIAAAGATLVRSCAPYDIVGGVPAKVLKNRLADATAAGKPLPADGGANRLTPPARHDPVEAADAGAPQKKSAAKTALSTAIKVLVSAALIAYLVSLQTGPAQGTFDSVVVGQSTRASVEADPDTAVRPPFLQRLAAKLKAMVTMKSAPQKLVPIGGAAGAEQSYGVGVKKPDGQWEADEQGPRIAVAYGPDGTVTAKRWERGFWASVWQQVKGFGRYWYWFLFAGSFHFLGYLITSWNWRQSMFVQGKKTRFWPLMGSNVIAGLFNNILPTNIGGDVVRVRDSAIAVFADRGRADVMRAGTVVVVQRVIGLFALVLIAMVAGASQAGDRLGESATSSLWTFAIAAAAVVVLCAVLLHPRVLARIAALLDIFRGLPLVGKLTAKFLVVLDTVAKYREQRGMLLRIFLTSILLQVNVVVYYYVCTKVVGYESVTFIKVFAAVPLVIILMTILPSINGVGVRDLGFMKLLGMNPAVAIAFSLIDVVWRLIWGAFGGLLLAVRGKVRPGAWVVGGPAASAAAAVAREPVGASNKEN